MKNIRLLSIAFYLLFPVAATAQVPYKRIADAGAEPGNWLTYSGDYQSHRFSRLAQITPANVGGLKTAWVYQFKQPGRQETPVVAGSFTARKAAPDATSFEARAARRVPN